MKAEFIGNLGRDAETKQSQDGRSFLTFSVADSYKQNGQEVTNWVDCTYNGVNLAQWLKKGCKVFVRGRLTTKLYTKKDGTQNVALSCAVSELEIVQFADRGEQQAGSQPVSNQPQPTSDMPF